MSCSPAQGKEKNKCKRVPSVSSTRKNKSWQPTPLLNPFLESSRGAESRSGNLLALASPALSPWVPPHLLLLLSGPSAVFWRCTASGLSSLLNRRWASVRDVAAITTSLSLKKEKIKASGTMIRHLSAAFWLKNNIVWNLPGGTCQCLGLHAPTAGGVSSIPGWGRKILHAVRCGQKMMKVKN